MTAPLSDLIRNDLVRAEVRSLLEQAPGFGALSREGRRQTAHDTVVVGECLADPEWLEQEPVAEPAAETIRTLREHIATPRAEGLAQGTGDSFVAGASEAGVQTFEGAVRTVDFPAFVSGLIQGVFKAIVDASIQQMQAFQTLVASVARTAAQIGQQDFTPAQGREYLLATYPDKLKAGGDDGTSIQLNPGASLDGDTAKKLGISPNSSLEDPDTQRTMLTNARTALGRQQQQTLATLVMMGINRIIVTNGRINAKVVFDVSASDDAASKSSNTSERDTDVQSAVSGGVAGLMGGWGGGFRSSRTSRVTTKVTTALDESSDAKMQLKAQLSGDVDLYFKSETFPLERLAPPASIDKVRVHAVPSDQESTS